MNQLQRSMLRVINDRYKDLSNLQEQLSTGKRLLRPSDDPVDVANTLKLTTKLKELSQFKKNINDGLAFMNVSGTAMESMNTLLQRTRELAIQGASDTLSDQERVYINKECEQLLRQMVSLIDTKYKGDYVFSGTQTKIPPLDIRSSTADTLADYNNLQMAYFNAGGMPVGSSVQIFNGFDDTPVQNIIPGTFELSVAGVNYVEGTDYQIDYESGSITILNAALALDVTPGGTEYEINRVKMNFDFITRGKDIYGNTVSNWGSIQREIESGITMQINITADELTTDTTSGYSLIGTMIRFGQSLLRSNQAGIEAAIGELDYVFSAVLSAQSKNGARMNRFDTTLDRNEDQYTETTSLKSELQDAELAQTISDFLLNQNVYDAALKSASKIIQPSLVNYL
ncbi:MAG: flagellar hook-associated protein FlgL [Fibrobacter sp.]|nr:flagellar hook-associated protein FlgL [Fibrobacter sp.]